jgi:MATE family multidrug resistance protein
LELKLDKIIDNKKDGSISQMIFIAVPMMISQACDTVMIFTDRLFLSQLGSEFMNASMGGGVTSFMMLSFFIGLMSYSTAMIAQYLGAKMKNKCSSVLTQTFVLCFIAYPILLCFIPLSNIFFKLLGISQVQLKLQNIYFSILMYASIISLLRFCISYFFSGIVRTRVVMLSSFIAMIANVIFNYIFIFGKLGMPMLGIRGAAYGTIIGSLTGLVVLLVAYFNKNNIKEFSILDSFKIDLKLIKKFLHFGFSTGSEMFLNVLAFNLMILIFHSHSQATATAATIMFNWDFIAFIPLLGVGIAVTSMVGRFKGAKRLDIAHKSVMSGFKIGTFYSSIILILFLVFPDFLVNIFRPNVDNSFFNEAFDMAVFMMRVASVYVLVESVFIVFIGALRGAGDTFWAMIISVSLHWIIAFMAFLTLKIFKIDPTITWVISVVLFFLFSFIVFFRYKTGKWKEIEVLQYDKENLDVLAAESFHESKEL